MYLEVNFLKPMFKDQFQKASTISPVKYLSA